MLLDGRSLAESIEAELRARVRRLIEAGGPTPGLAAVSPDLPAASAYAQLKAAACERIGVVFREIVLPKTAEARDASGPAASDAKRSTQPPAATRSTRDALDAIDRLNADPDVHGILVQHPLPDTIDARACFDRIAAAKDVDAVGTVALGRFAAGDSDRAPATVAATMRLLDQYRLDVTGRHAVVAGTGALFALPMAIALLRAGANVSMPGEDVARIEATLAGADLIVSGIGRPRAIPPDWLKDGMIVVDAGYFNEGGVGDVDIGPAVERVAAYAPVPGGVGPMTVAMLLEATVRVAENAITS